MPLAVDVELLTGTYEAGVGGERAEWPPHPARLFCAMVAQARSEAEWDALRWLERQGVPEVFAPEASEGLLRGFVPTNAVSSRRGGGAYLARTNGKRVWPRALPGPPLFRFVWRATPDEETLRHLRALAGRVAYLGRPAGMALPRLSVEVPSVADGMRRFVPAQDGPLVLRVPYPGYLDALREAFDSEEPAHAVARGHPYVPDAGSVAPDPAGTPASGPYDRLLTFGFPPGSGVAGWHAARVGTALRDAVLSRLGHPRSDDPWPPFGPDDLAPIHGHGGRLPPEERCAFLALPFVGSDHASGEAIGVGVAIGRAVPPDLRRALLLLFGLDREEGPRLEALRIPGPGVALPLSPPDGRRSIEPARWQGPSRRWASVTPVVLDRWPKRWAGARAVLVRGVRLAGYPDPQDLEVWRGSAVNGAPVLRPGDRKRRAGDPARPWAHVVVTFSDPIRGPVLLGHLRFVGLGLCAPLGGDG